MSGTGIQFANLAQTVLAGPITSTATSCNVAAGTGAIFPQVTTANGEFFMMSFYDEATQEETEIVKVTNVATDTFTIVRAQEGTAARAWIAGDLADNLLTAGSMAGFQRALGFTPVQQNGGTGQLNNKIYIGWTGTQLTAQVDTNNQGPFAMLNVACTFLSAVAVHGALSSSTAISTPGTIQSTGNMTTANQFSSGNGMITSGTVAIGSGTVTDPVVSSTNGILASPTGVINSYSGGSAWSTGSGVLHAFYSNGFVAVGSISTNGSSTSYNTTSDYRLKINVILLTGALDRIASVPVRRFGFIDQVSEENQDPILVDGWFAHEMAVGVPEAVSGTKDATATHTNVVIGPNGGIAATGVTQAEWQAGMLPVAEVAAVPAIPAQEAVPGTATTPAIPAQAAVPAVAYVPGRGPLYAAGSTWQATITVPIYQQIAQDKTAPVMWGGLQEARTRIVALETLTAAQATAIEALQTALAAVQAQIATLTAATTH
jgi:hypothetical protein